MATWFPASLAAEFVLISLVFFLWNGRLPSRMLAIGCVAVQIPLWLAKQIFWNLDTGATTGFFYPISIITTIPFVFTLFTYVAMANLFEGFGRDIFGRKIKE
jgi:hypothetical protein